jgi:hypothetical protein
LILAAAVHAGIAATIATAVLPAVVADAFPAATPERAVPALWVITAANLLLALWYFAIGAGHLRISAVARLAWAIGLVLSLLVTAPLLDAAFAYWSHGQAMRVAAIALFGCVIGGAFCAVLVFVSHRRQNHAAGGV